MSSPYPHLSQAPITEALLDIRVVQDPETTASTLQGFSSGVDTDFPEARPIHRINYQFTANPGPNDVSGSSEVLGNIYWNADHSRAVQARVDGFSVNCVGSYTDWEALREQARTLWRTYCQVARPIQVQRCALRYINRLSLSAGGDLRTQLRTRPELSPELPQPIAEYFMRVLVPFDEVTQAVITQATENPSGNSADRSLILDIDVSTTGEIAPDSEALWATFERLRDIKNTCFFSSLEKITWEAYQ